MSAKTISAFGDLRERATADQNGPQRDRISLIGHIVEVEIGAFQSERGTRQRLSFDAVVEVKPSKGALTDDVDDILSYDTIADAIAYELAAERLNLLETLAERIAGRILLRDAAEKVFLRIQKLDRGPGALGVEIVRSDTDVSPKEDINKPRPAALMVALSKEAQASPNLLGWLKTLDDCEHPVVILPDGADKGDAAKDRSIENRLALLEYERACLLLADKCNAVSVIETKTELEHAAHTGLLVAWAPAKIVLDAVDSPVKLDPLSLLGWLSQQVPNVGTIAIGSSASLDDVTPHDVGVASLDDALKRVCDGQ